MRLTERGLRDSCLGQALQVKVFAEDYRALGWEEIWQAFIAAYPGRWAVQVFPPRDALVNGKAVYHLWVCDEPRGLNVKVS